MVYNNNCRRMNLGLGKIIEGRLENLMDKYNIAVFYKFLYIRSIRKLISNIFDWTLKQF